MKKILLPILCLFLYTCDSDDPVSLIEGCLDSQACNYNQDASIDNGSCTYAEENYDCSGFPIDYDLCEDYIFNSSSSFDPNVNCDESNDNTIYSEGDKLRCNDVEENFNLCFPNNCDEELNLSKLYGKVIWIEFTASWCSTCYINQSNSDELINNFINNPDVFILTILMDEGQPYTCSLWAEAGNDNIPVIASGGNSISLGGISETFESLFYDTPVTPRRVFIDHELNVHSIHSGYMSDSQISFEINEMLELLNQN